MRRINPYILAAYRQQHQKFKEAVEIAEEMIRDAHQDRVHKGAAFNSLGLALYDQKKYDGAIAQYQKAATLYPKLAIVHYNWGLALYGQKKYIDATAQYQKAAALDPKLAINLRK